MKKLIFSLLTCAILNCAFADTKLEPPVIDAQQAAGQDEAEYISDQLKLVAKSHHEENAQLSYVIDVTYPQIVGANLTPAATQFNALAKDLVRQEMDRFKRYVTADMPHMQNLPSEARHNSLNIDYDDNIIRPEGNTIISIRLAIQGMQAGRAHPYHATSVLNFDLANSKILTFDDLFKPKTNFLKFFSSYSSKKLAEKLTDKWMIADGTKPLPKNFKHWNLDADGIILTFDEYQVAPYVDGIQEVTIPYSDLEHVLAASTPVKSCIENKKACQIQMVIPDSQEESIEQSKEVI